MAKQRKVDPFYLVITDRDRKLFCVVGPMSDDTDWNRKVDSAQKLGREVNCYTANRSLSREQIVSETAKRIGFAHSDTPLV